MQRGDLKRWINKPARETRTKAVKAGEIVATDNGDATSFVPFQSHERPAFNGMALVIIKAKKGMKGKVVVKASSEKLITGQTTVIVQ